MRIFDSISLAVGKFFADRGIGLRSKLIAIFTTAEVFSLALLSYFAWMQLSSLGVSVRDIAVDDAVLALNTNAVEEIERITTDIAGNVANFLYQRDDDIRYIASIKPTEENYRAFIMNRRGRVVRKGKWVLAEDGRSWVREDEPEPLPVKEESSIPDNNDWGAFHSHPGTTFEYDSIPLYDEIAFIGLDGQELVKVVANDSPKTRYPMSRELRDISKKENTYIKAEDYFPQLRELGRGEIYVSDVIGAYTGANYIGMYTPEILKEAEVTLGYEIEYAPEEQAFAGKENPNGRRFEGIVRWAMPVYDDYGWKIGYVTFALNHDHLMEFVDHRTPTFESYTELSSAYDGNYSFIWDHKGRSICHPRHNSIYGFNPETGDPEIPWLDAAIYNAWQDNAPEKKWFEYIRDEEIPPFDGQSRQKGPARALTKAGLVGLDGRYLNFAPQCTGWRELTETGSYGSLYILWSGLYKLTTAAAIPYYTGQYAPSSDNGFTRRGFGIVTIGAGLDSFTAPALDMETKITKEIDSHIIATLKQLVISTGVLVLIVVIISLLVATWLGENIMSLIRGVLRLRGGVMHFRFNSQVKDEFGLLQDAFDAMAESIKNNFKNPLTIIDKNRRIIYMNEQGLEFCGISRIDDAVGTLYDDTSIYPAGSEYDPIHAMLEGRDADVFYVAERDRYLKPSSHYFIGMDGEIIGYIIESMDVTELRKTQLNLEQAINDANAASRHKSEFLARMSHEIRTPMNAIIGLTGIIHKRLDTIPEQTEAITEIESHVTNIESSSHHLLSLLNDILDISKIEAGKIELADEPITMDRIVSAVDSIIRPRCREKNIEFVTDIDDFGQTVFMCDSLRLRQVLINLLGNAVKFTPERGKVEFRMNKTDERDGEMQIQFYVGDTGIGIAKESIPHVFEAFEQAHNKISKQYGGTGLGLPISRNIVRLFGGDIETESELGKGTVFKFSIWFKMIDAELPGEVTAEDLNGKLEGKRMLLVDDVEINRVIVATMLEDTGIEIDEASDGTEAVEIFEKSEPGTYDIVLMDIQMPKMSGYDASLAIRSLDRQDARDVPIIALTANAFRDDIQKAYDSKMNAHAAKPVEENVLMDIMVRFLLGGNAE